MILLAKPDEGLFRHTENSLRVFRSLKEAYSNIPEICGVGKFWEHLFYAVFLHDFGKAATGFQQTFNKKGEWYRHEILSAGFVSALKNIEEVYRNAIALSIITHHKDILDLRERYQTCPSPVGKKRYEEKLTELEPNLNELRAYCDLIPHLSRSYLGYELGDFSAINSTKDLLDVYKEVVLDYCNKWEDDEKTILHGKYGIFLKGFLNACDHLASASKYSILNGIQDMRHIYNFPELRETQKEALKTEGDVFLTAPTGSGKTEAALLWSDRNQNPKKSRRVFYLLPYTASINAMHDRLIRDFRNRELVGLMHGKATYFLYKSFSDEEYTTARDKAREIKNITRKIYRPYKILTPFQILKAFFGIQWFELQMAEMGGGLFILDEIHAYDAHTTALLLEMLKILKTDYGANIMIMSATFPQFIKDILKEELGIKKEIALEKKELRKFTRHRVKILDGEILMNIKKINADLDKNKRVLIVCNTVSRAQEIFKAFSPRIRESVLLHGRFMLRDREEIEKKIKTAKLLVGTQAIEVSLDIDYDVMYSEPAPIDALIQRFGRVNRRGWEKNRIADTYVFTKGSDNDKYVYNSDIVKKTIDIITGVDLLEEDIIQEVVDQIYGKGYAKNDREEFNRVRSMFKPFYSRIVPFIHDKRNDEDFYSLYQSYEVIPMGYKAAYLEEIKNGRYLEAMSYHTNISIGQYKKLEKESRVEVQDKNIFVNADYKPDLGLLLEEYSLENSNIL